MEIPDSDRGVAADSSGKESKAESQVNKQPNGIIRCCRKTKTCSFTPSAPYLVVVVSLFVCHFVSGRMNLDDRPKTTCTVDLRLARFQFLLTLLLYPVWAYFSFVYRSYVKSYL